MVGAPMPEPESFSCSFPKDLRAQIRKQNVSKHNRCNRRMHERFLALRERRKPGCVAATAVARELAGFVWAIGSEAQALAAAQGSPA